MDGQFQSAILRRRLAAGRRQTNVREESSSPQRSCCEAVPNIRGGSALCGPHRGRAPDRLGSAESNLCGVRANWRGLGRVGMGSPLSECAQGEAGCVLRCARGRSCRHACDPPPTPVCIWPHAPCRLRCNHGARLATPSYRVRSSGRSHVHKDVRDGRRKIDAGRAGRSGQCCCGSPPIR